ncbi:flagellar biosynthesis anti-sigma factor FlgM [sulfur-oxidizing endosymbiont of Gigantopelta aegis]|uniref:flagellar biosynthesis anti-sigma factor FlgM n=1 Tax=sulfur-oxidizing endosymbiont of Gigantopelta aegis TaxID=2794934 RepID=UPI0018DBC0D0|nr:flagellar biosynthesis anti-sigma factor FlgM [sulfur-oxidizing endosymbiont of Gigantopelta aegis]
MPINISNISNNTTPTSRANEQISTKSSSKSSAKSVQAPDIKSNQTSNARLAQDSVNLTDSTQRIKSLEAQIAQLPIIDTQKVETIKNSLSNGSFEFNSARIAEKLINFEKDFL